MPPADTLIAQARAYNPDADADRIAAAHAYAVRAHEGQARRSGEPYVIHPIAVASILAAQRMDDDTLITALLHDTVEDTAATTDELTALFGTHVAEMVDGVTKLTNLELTRAETKQAENFRKLFLAMSKDVRVLLVKLADRLHNMRTIAAMPPEKQAQKARETMEIFAPLAGRMGMQSLREELEDLAFEVLQPVARRSVMRRFAALQRANPGIVDGVIADIQSVLARDGIAAEVHGRAKKPYSIWRKMQEKDLAFQRLSDIYGFRVICEADVAPEADCYRALGAIHQRWAAVPGRFKDYISQPKSNGYRSIHTTVSGRNAKRVEVQIRTREMHEVAEAGIAAHWSYRDGAPAQNRFAVDPARWIEAMAERFAGEGGDDQDFLEHVKLEMYSDQVFCFTPKGEVVKLPRGATPVDFAYAVHTKVGDHTQGAKIDGHRAPLFTRLRNGQSVEIITAQGQRPQASWLEMAVTGRARSAIRRSLRVEDRERMIRLGAELVRVAFAQIGRRATDKALGVAAKALALTGTDELLARVGSAELSARRVVDIVWPGQAPKAPAAPGEAVIGLPPGQTPVRGACCEPLPGQRIVGITYRGDGVVLHAIDCARLADHEDEPQRWIDVRWSPGRHPVEHPVTVELTISNGVGVLGRICTLVGEQGANIADMTFLDRKPDYFRLRMVIELSDQEHWHAVQTALEAETDLAELRRHRGGPAHGAAKGAGAAFVRSDEGRGDHVPAP
ncbi:RelA/SpoT family protein [Hasllibacter halocynthiae]|uniref:RelA/SpoT family protein n=1 Tax=Hasllibacter halocynthiae TaxID=595589 RepID=UPI000D08512E|nr:bifunctional (p)ppGpp synthetase/guanosine-3',5'-bis(diphosphate) 3'-pyrophosphohydrolase [Hasllibacter halocynthiae]